MGAFGIILFFLASAVVGSRLLLLYFRLRQPPELFLGLAYLIAGTLAWGGLLVGAATTPPGQSLSEGYQAWSVWVGNTGTLCFYLFVWYVFRRDSRVTKLLVALVALVFAVSIAQDTIINGVTFGVPPGSWTTRLAMLGRAAVFPWMAGEAFAKYLAFRRRARIGLGNPVVANRLLLWGLSAVATFLLSGLATLLYLIATDNVDATVKQNQATTVYGVLALLSAVPAWLAFFPPKAYVAWLKSSQPEAGHG